MKLVGLLCRNHWQHQRTAQQDGLIPVGLASVHLKTTVASPDKHSKLIGTQQIFVYQVTTLIQQGGAHSRAGSLKRQNNSLFREPVFSNEQDLAQVLV